MLRKVLTTVSLAATATAGLCAKDIKGTVKDTEGKGVAGVVVSAYYFTKILFIGSACA